ncbi:hypothetical protein SELMODRAFT_91374 [Selaginella moellendorffii]|uniref:tyrosine--tRNA ligase n=1 Tax=Selaginella moellendorffii TaxID=88036 RepID=D8RE22_SELML|nr:hypothetical protein SELMODRAFT_91374 [Selaginella moellendorffii]
MEEERFRLIRSVAHSCDDEDGLRAIVGREASPICFDSFEPRQRMPIAQGLLKTLIVNQLVDAGCSVKIWIGDWVAEQRYCVKNEKTKLRAAGEYMIEVWRAAGMKVDQVEFIWASDVINGPRTAEYWPLVLDVARRCDLPRVLSCLGLSENWEEETIPSSELLYPCMQCASMFLTKAHICLLGADKHNVINMIGNYCNDFDKERRPVFLSNSMLPSLERLQSLEAQKEMSRSSPDSCLFMDDEEKDVKKKINGAFCAEKVLEKNPCMDLAKLIVFPWCRELTIKPRSDEGTKTFTSVEDLSSDYSAGSVHPGDLKNALTESVNKILQPIRDHLKANSKAKELLLKMKVCLSVLFDSPLV